MQDAMNSSLVYNSTQHASWGQQEQHSSRTNNKHVSNDADLQQKQRVTSHPVSMKHNRQGTEPHVPHSTMHTLATPGRQELLAAWKEALIVSKDVHLSQLGPREDVYV
jgi:hypothetical protein